MAALAAGQTNPKVLAQLARGRMRAKLSELEEAFTGHFTDHHASCPAERTSETADR
jgi:transposase